MIQKLKKQNTWGECLEKLNEVIDAVNLLQCKNVHIESDLQDLMYPKEIKGEFAENVQDKFAEQRKWIGKLCEFWDNDDTQDIEYGVLTAITTDCGIGFCCNDEYEYDNCQPVKPDDDIIYKGE